jgi:PKD repeat protein
MAYFKQNPSVAVQFSATGTNNPPYDWMWSYPGGNVSYVSDPTLVLTYNKYGYYGVSRTISNTLGKSTSSTTISLCPLVASFTATPVQGQVPVTVQFTDTSTDQPISWLWNFGDGATTKTQNPVHTYTTSGVYTVRLDATNNLGSCWYTGTISVSPLAASFISNQTTGPVPLTVQFTDISTDQPTSWFWNFGDGTSSNLQNPVHTYTNNGTFTANLSAYNGYDGWMSSPGSQITAYTPFSVSFTASPTSGMPGTSVIFNDQSTGFPTPGSWYWDFGDGYNSTQQNPSHQYVSPGVYTVAHSATNSQGTLWSNKTAFISIS